MGATTAVSLASTAWVSISNAGERVLLQRLSGIVYLAIADNQPSAGFNGALRLTDDTPLNIRGTSQLWARAGGRPAFLSLTMLPADEAGRGGDTSLASIDAKTPPLLAGAVPVHLINPLDLSGIAADLSMIKDSCLDIDANTDTVETTLSTSLTQLTSNGTLTVITQLQAVDGAPF